MKKQETIAVRNAAKFIKVAVIREKDGEGYFIHSTHAESPKEMFKQMGQIWNFDPENETIEIIEIDLNNLK